MKKPTILVMLLTFLLSLTLLSPSQSFACSCMAPGSVEEEFSKVNAVFSGKVIRIEESSPSSPDDFMPVKVVFEVKNTWKGTQDSEVAVFTGTDSASCGYSFVQGKNYLVYATESEGKLITSLCSITKPLAAADKDLSILKDGEQPTKITKIPEQSNSGITWIILACLLIAAISYSIMRVMKKE
ncbi:hypothetical protein [Bacillus suaedaesalsae]|uniref:Tissue inhibitor of metalloproteinase n=1 Tax=Bacillus suaedaesalsae TaxID=2810349 RepID=A0ABS2DDX4_9BACI|nr:hypothetical protein [Bacillus suaedaesalsae]MBM6616230.1 hypothetical protein [Bacillus suaedaesalsae]